MTDYQFCMILHDGGHRVITVGAENQDHAHDMFHRIYGTEAAAFLYQHPSAFVQELVDNP